MRAKTPQIVALGGGGFSMERDCSLLDDYVLSLIERPRPRVCFLPTASGDADHYVVRFYRRFSATCEASHVSLFRRDQGVGGVETELPPSGVTCILFKLTIKLVISGGRLSSPVAPGRRRGGAWRAHDLDEVLHRAWRRGVVLCGPSAGSLCWFSEALSAFHGPPRAVRGLGLLPFSNCVHYDAEPERRTQYHRFVADGMPGGFAVEDGVALHFRRTRLRRVVSSRTRAWAYRVEATPEGVVETRLATSYLGAAGGDACEPPAVGAARSRQKRPRLSSRRGAAAAATGSVKAQPLRA